MTAEVLLATPDPACTAHRAAFEEVIVWKCLQLCGLPHGAAPELQRIRVDEVMTNLVEMATLPTQSR